MTVNGHQEILAAPASTPAVLHSTVRFSVQALGVIILLTAAMLALRSAFNLSNNSFALIYVLAISSFVAVAGIVSKNARSVFAQITTIAKYAFDRQKGDLTKILPREGSAEPGNQDEQ